MKLLSVALLPAVAAAAYAAEPPRQFIEAWLENLLRKGPEWLASAEAARVAGNLLLYQRENGGWPKGKDAHKVLSEQERAFNDPAGFDFRRKDRAAAPGGARWWLLKQGVER